jgi:aryl-alcohol dehydrogenase-like predicted oxidoreductase
VITTKVFNSVTGTPGDAGLAPDRIRRQVEGSLERLGIDRIDLYVAHAADPDVQLEDTIATFQELRTKGLIGAWGLSNHDAVAVRAACEVGAPSLVQNSFSLLDRDDERDLLPFCRERGIRYVPFGPLAGGWLTGKYRRGEDFPEGSRMTQRPEPYEAYRDDRVFGALDLLRDEAEERGLDMAALAFAWVLHKCDGAVCGPTRASHLDPVLAARHVQLTQQDVTRIGAFFG